MPIGTHPIALYVNGDSMAYFDSFGVEHILEQIKKFATKISQQSI